MRYTLLSVTERGVVLLDQHLRRLALEPRTRAFEDFASFCREAAPGAWAVWVDEAAGLRVERRPGSRLRDGMPVRFLPSPLPAGAGLIPKPPPPGPFAPLRLDGVATLLTSPDGSEIWEACSAAVLGWDGARLICPPLDRPRVWSTAEAAIREHLHPDMLEAPIPSRGMPILLVNAIKGPCTVNAPACGEFPAAAKDEIDRLLASLRAGRRRPH